MRKTRIYLVLAVVVLLTLGWFLFRFLNGTQSLVVEDEGFRAWFWENRGLDLVVQMLLVFAGALGIAAILPVEDEDA